MSFVKTVYIAQSNFRHLLFIDHYSNVVVSIHFDSLRLLYDLRPICQEGVQAIGSCGKLRLAQVGVDFVGSGD